MRSIVVSLTALAALVTLAGMPAVAEAYGEKRFAPRRTHRYAYGGYGYGYGGSRYGYARASSYGAYRYSRPSIGYSRYSYGNRYPSVRSPIYSGRPSPYRTYAYRSSLYGSYGYGNTRYRTYRTYGTYGAPRRVVSPYYGYRRLR